MKRTISRRSFLGAASAAAVAWHIVPRHVLGGRGFTPPSEKVAVAGIGVGGQGTSDLRSISETNHAAIVAVCDVDPARTADLLQQYPGAKAFGDYRKMLDELKTVDGIVVATPDHHHAFAAMEGIRRGKHVYCEKPLTHSVWEARQLAE